MRRFSIKNKSKAEPLTNVQKIGYGIGDLANGLTFGLSSTFLIAFYTDVLGLSALAAGTLFLAARIWDAVNDPLMGALADKLFRRRLTRIQSARRRGVLTREVRIHGGEIKRGKGIHEDENISKPSPVSATPKGPHLSRAAASQRRGGNPAKRTEKFRPYLLKGSWPVVVTAVLMFFAPPGLSPSQKLIWAYATYIAWGMAYTFINIPYGSLAAVITCDPVERSVLSVSRGIGGLIGAVGVRSVVPAFLVTFADNEEKGFLLAAALLGLLSFAGYIASYFMTEETVEHTAETEAPFSIKDSFKVLIRNRPFLAVSLASVAMQTGLMVNGAMNIYYFRENLNALELLGFTGVIALGPMIIAAPAIPRLVKKFGTKTTSWTAALVSALLYMILLALPSHPWPYLSFSLAAAFFLMIPNMLVWGQVSDCIDYNQYLSGARQEGVIYGSYSFMRKMGQAFAGFVAGAGLGHIGYKAEAAMQSAATLRGIKFLTIGVPSLCMLVVFIAYRFLWNLTPEKQAEVTAAIAADEISKTTASD